MNYSLTATSVNTDASRKADLDFLVATLIAGRNAGLSSRQQAKTRAEAKALIDALARVQA